MGKCNTKFKPNLDPVSFGGTPAAIAMCDIIKKHKLPTHTLGKMLANYNETLKELNKLDKYKYQISILVLEKYLSCVGKYPTIIRTYLKNIIRTMYKKWLKK